MPRGAGGVASCHGGAAWVQGADMLSESLFSGVVQLWWSSLSLSLPSISPSPGHGHVSPARHTPPLEGGGLWPCAAQCLC